MQVYIEYVLIDNFIIDYLLLKATFAIVGKSAIKKRLFVCAFLGAIFALAFPLLERVKVLSVLYKIACGLFLVLIADKRHTFRSFYITSLTFFLLTFLMGGAIIGVFNILGVDYSSEIYISLMFLPVYFFIKLTLIIIRYFYRKRTDVCLTYRVEVVCGKSTVSALGFMDTGNTLYDGDKPVILCAKSFAKRVINADALRVKIKKINVTTANGSSINFAFTIDCIKIYLKDEPNIYNNVTLCVIGDGVFDGYDLILHPKFLEGENYAGAFGVEKVS